MSTNKVLLAGSERQPIGTRVSDQPNDEMVEVSVVLKPKLRATVPGVGGQPLAREEFAEKHGADQSAIDKVKQFAQENGLTVENVLLRDIQLPATLKAAIEAKQQAEQESLAMNFRLQKETQEAQRKRIEAAGVRDFQQIVAQGITPSLLEWKGIEATENLAKSPNSKVVVIGNNKNGLPLILGQ